LVDSGLENDKIWLCVFMLVVLTVVFRLLVILSLKCQDNKKSKGMTDLRNTVAKKPKREAGNDNLLE